MTHCTMAGQLYRLLPDGRRQKNYSSPNAWGRPSFFVVCHLKWFCHLKPWGRPSFFVVCHLKWSAILSRGADHRFLWSAILSGLPILSRGAYTSPKRVLIRRLSTRNLSHKPAHPRSPLKTNQNRPDIPRPPYTRMLPSSSQWDPTPIPHHSPPSSETLSKPWPPDPPYPAAATYSIHRVTVFRWMKTSKLFAEALRLARANFVLARRDALFQLSNRAIETLMSILDNPGRRLPSCSGPPCSSCNVRNCRRLAGPCRSRLRSRRQQAFGLRHHRAGLRRPARPVQHRTRF